MKDRAEEASTKFFVDNTKLFVCNLVENGGDAAKDDGRRREGRETMARKASNRPTDAELGILGVLWRLGPSTVREVHAELERAASAATGPTGYTTVLKQLQIMTDKGWVVRDESQRAHVYRAGEPRERTQLQLVGDLVDRAFEGSAGQLVLQALASRRASANEIAEIRRILDDLEGEPEGDA
jgi:predicted transcriptional regulator